MKKEYTDFVMKSVFRFFRKLIKGSKKETASSTQCVSDSVKTMRVKIGYCVKPAGTGCLERKQIHGKAEYSEDEICGDTATWCNLPREKKALILSDGMGKGADAALCSQKVVRKLRTLLKNGFLSQQALRATNELIIELKTRQIIKEDDFATIDLAVIDYAKRKAYFYKMGAAASFLVRGEKVLKIHQKTLPAGIVKDIEITQFTTNIEPGDMIVMASDGVVEADRGDFEGKWLIKFLAHEGTKVKRGEEQRPRNLASQIIDMAVAESDGYEEDDMTILVAVITEE